MKIEIISIIKNILEEEVLESTNKDNAKNWDSLNHIKIILALQSKFNIKFSVEEISNSYNVNSLINLVSSKLS
ncbi:MAG TPA: acyl carrier protein [Melioribacteraceae bacterium]|nr:acyl carrier protein [Melioribacteraceae bacterium]